jgi:DNA-binding PadR family transcriptional regulator
MYHRFRFGFGPRAERFFQKGDFKYLILELLKEKPRHGYEIIRELEERFHGFYAPSPGSVYPTLQRLEEMGYVTSSQQEGKKIYTITEEGRKFLVEREKQTDEFKSQMKNWFDWWTPEIRRELHDIRHELGDLWRLLAHKARRADAEKLRRIRETISKACEEIEGILRQ